MFSPFYRFPLLLASLGLFFNSTVFVFVFVFFFNKERKLLLGAWGHLLRSPSHTCAPVPVLNCMSIMDTTLVCSESCSQTVSWVDYFTTVIVHVFC